jgi:hypothetical protein
LGVFIGLKYTEIEFLFHFQATANFLLPIELISFINEVFNDNVERLADRISYYRLKQTDYDGKTSYSAMKSAEFNLRDDLMININPSSFLVERTFHTNEYLENANLFVYNSSGQGENRAKCS